MPELMYLNGEYLPPSQGRISAEDRGFTFADGVYDVVRVYGGQPFAMRGHLERFFASAAGIEITPPHPLVGFEAILHQLIDRSELQEAILYLQMTRGAEPRNHIYTPGLAPTVMAHVRPAKPRPESWNRDGVMALPHPDIRWNLCHLKTIALLPNILAKNRAVKAGGIDALFFMDDGTVTEGSATNAYAVRGGEIWTAPLGPKILPGITRHHLLAVCEELGIRVHERALTLREFEHADEVFLTATTIEVLPVARLGDKSVGDGKPGPTTRRLLEAFRERVRAACGQTAAVR